MYSDDVVQMTGQSGQLFAFHLPDQHTAPAMQVLERSERNRNRRGQVPGCNREWNSDRSTLVRLSGSPESLSPEASPLWPRATGGASPQVDKSCRPRYGLLIDGR